MKIVVFGGNGFIGRHLVRLLSGLGHELTVPVRDREKAKELIMLPSTDVVAYNSLSPAQLSPYLRGADAAVNLTGILNERRGGDFMRTHNEFVRILCECCAAESVRRLVHVSALNALGNAPSEYLRSKAKGEQIIRAAPVRCVIIRPSVVYGQGDAFVSLFVRMARRLPVLMLPCADAEMQPVAVGDLAAIIAHVIETGEEDRKTLQVGGPQKLTLSEIVRAALSAAQTPRPVADLGQLSSYMLAMVAEATPGVHILSRDNCLSATRPSVVSGENDAARILGELTTLQAGLAAMFAQSTGADVRARARR